MLDITWGVVGLSCGIVGSMVYSWVEQKKHKVGTKPEEPSYEAPALVKGTDHNTTPQIRISFIDAMNGRILEVSTQIPHPGVANHYDWKTEMYVVPEDQKLSEAISTVMLMKGLDR